MNNIKINHFDIGLAWGHEIKMSNDIYSQTNIPFKIYAIDAEENSYNYCKKKYKDFNNIEIFKYAISSEDNKDIKIYLQNDKKTIKQGNSIYKTKDNVLEEKYQFVKSIKFSTFLKNENIDLDNSINILRVNIEGAEWDLINDIINNNLQNKIQIYLGAGSDIEKVKELKDKNIHVIYDNMLSNNNIMIKRYCYSSYWRNIILQKILIENNNYFSNFYNKEITFLSVHDNLILKKNSIFKIEWKIDKNIKRKLGNKIMIILQRYNVNNNPFVNIINQTNIIENYYNWNVIIDDYYKKIYNNSNNYLFFFVILFPDVYPLYINWSRPFKINN